MKKVILIVLSILTCFCMAIGLTACGKNGQSSTPTIEIGSDGYWYINGKKTNCKASGEKGEQGEKGEPGQDGKNGLNGKDGKDSYGNINISLTPDQLVDGTNAAIDNIRDIIDNN